jgi:hypothetical protein
LVNLEVLVVVVLMQILALLLAVLALLDKETLVAQHLLHPPLHLHLAAVVQVLLDPAQAALLAALVEQEQQVQ